MSLEPCWFHGVGGMGGLGGWMSWLGELSAATTFRFSQALFQSLLLPPFHPFFLLISRMQILKVNFF